MPTSAAVWVVGTDLLYPEHDESEVVTGTLAASDIGEYIGEYVFTFEENLSANVPYGLRLIGDATVVEGFYAPVGLQTRLTSDLGAIGPVIDTNPVFDSFIVKHEPLLLELKG